MGIWETIATTIQQSVVSAALLTGSNLVVTLSGQTLPATVNALFTGGLVIFVLKNFIQNLFNELDNAPLPGLTAVGAPAKVRLGDKSAPF